MGLISRVLILEKIYIITGYAIKVHKELRPGLLESFYKRGLKYELEGNGHEIRSQIWVTVLYGEITLYTELKIDLFVDG
ncbi:GxxExxY protein [Pedobacter segetis]|uniref:GxxExxY protein n=1 Tax=Pedobacter segetis TaxID=2793069 RepID=UPI00293D54A4|nr:GxxExxY protein [Pedobacter segetis]